MSDWSIRGSFCSNETDRDIVHNNTSIITVIGQESTE